MVNTAASRLPDEKRLNDVNTKANKGLNALFPQGMITIVLECIDRLNVYNTAAHFSEFAGEEAAESWKEIVNLLYELLGREATQTSVYVFIVFNVGKNDLNLLCVLNVQPL